MKRVIQFLTLLREGSWMAWGAVIFAAGQAGIAHACGELGLLTYEACSQANETLQVVGGFLGFGGAANSPGIRRPNG